MAKRDRRRVPYQLAGTIENPTQQQLARYLSIARRMNEGQVPNEQELDLFVRVSLGGFEQAELDKAFAILEKSKKPGEKFDPEAYKIWVDQARKQLASPEYKDKVLRIAEAQDIKNKNTAFSNALGILATGTDLATSLGQIAKYKQSLKQIKEPGAMPVLGESPELKAAMRAAEQGTYAPSIAAEAAKAGLREQYGADINAAKIASAGQAGAFGAGAQAASTRRTRGELQMMPMVEGISQQRAANRAQLAGMSADYERARNQSQQRAAELGYDKYIRQSEAAAKLGQAGYANLRESMYGMADVLPQALANRRIKSKYDSLYNTLWGMGMPPEQAAKYAGVGSQAPIQERISGPSTYTGAGPSPYTGYPGPDAYTPPVDNFDPNVYQNVLNYRTGNYPY